MPQRSNIKDNGMDGDAFWRETAGYLGSQSLCLFCAVGNESVALAAHNSPFVQSFREELFQCHHSPANLCR